MLEICIDSTFLWLSSYLHSSAFQRNLGLIKQTVDHQAPPAIGFSRQEYWIGLSCPPLGDLPDSGMEPVSPALQADSLPLSHQGSPKHVILSERPRVA